MAHCYGSILETSPKKDDWCITAKIIKWMVGLQEDRVLPLAIEMVVVDINSRCTLCNVDIETGSLIPNLALRAAAAAVKHEDDRRLFRNAALRKRRKEMGEPMDPIRRVNRENGDFTSADGLQRGVQYPFSVNEKVIIKGNRRTPEKFVGKEAIITSQCLNGWYLLKIIGSGENVRLQYRSLRKLLNTPTMEDQCQLQPIQNSSS
ncbi:hypothetical protein TSUD_91390 [Trifolium subterraneum]|uniref:PUB 62/63 C-terminal domain-containing protein n=1 Tax=Trifolium subterraneum TaxID=3900 RepID=A0A2Z6PSC0_TRISU|nr:hypothetical protein TSUD_91390 [Trifolium subterraneum]